MSTADCFERLNSIASIYNNANPTESTARLRIKPLLFELPGCQGNVWPDPLSSNKPTAEDEYVPSLPGPMNSFWIPSGWQVIFHSTTGSVKYPPKPVSFPILRIYSSVDLASSVPDIYHNFSNATLIPPTLDHNIPDLRLKRGDIIDETNWKLMRCNSNIPVIYMGQSLYRPYTFGSPECDDFFTGFCARGSPHREDPICSCIREEDEIVDKYCLPGNSNTKCVNRTTLAPFIPVRCLGKTCSLHGYLLRRMDRKCDITLCQQVVDISEGVISDLNNTIWCGDRHVENDEGTLKDLDTGVDPKFETKEKPIEGPLSSDSLPFQLVIVIVIVLVFFFVGIPLYIQNVNLQKQVNQQSFS